MLPEQTDVLIVGAGPTGLAVALKLQQAGVSHVLIDKLAEGGNTSRAAVIHAHTLERLEDLGVSGDLAGQGLKLDTFRLRERGRALITLKFDHLASAYNYLLMVPQNITERIMSDRLGALGGKLHRGVEALAVRQHDDICHARLKTAAGEHKIKARYVVGADGMHSLVRDAAGIAFEGETYEDGFMLADVRMRWPFPGEGAIFFAPEGLVVVAPLPDGSFRIVATMEDAPAEPALSDVQTLMDTRGPEKPPIEIEKVVWSSRFRIHHRLVERYRAGALLLVGDAAHVHSPAGGQGMNCGLVDACVLGELLGDVVRGVRTADALDEYERLRRPAAKQVLALASRMTGIATLRGKLLCGLRNFALRMLDHVAPFKARLANSLAGLDRKSLARLPEPKSRN